jgi:hypothetical protein
MQNLGPGQVKGHKSLEPLPRPPAALTAPPQRESPVSRDLLPERFEPRQVSRNGMVIEVPTDDLLQPVPGFRNWLMPASAQFHSDTPEFCRHPLARRLTMHRELAAFVDRAADMLATGADERPTLSWLTGPLYGDLSDKADHAASPLVKPHKIERFRFPLPFPFPVFRREPPELNQACLVRVEFQPVVRQTLPQLLQKPLGLLPVLKPKHKVVRISNDDYIAECILPAPLHHPLVKYVVQIDIRQQRRDHRSGQRRRRNAHLIGHGQRRTGDLIGGQGEPSDCASRQQG